MLVSLCATGDKPSSDASRYCSQPVGAAGDKVDEMTLPNAGHFELIDPQSAAFAPVRAAIERLQK